MEQRSEAWFDARKGKMTCSRMAEAIGLIGSRRRLWRELTGRESGVRTNARMQDGMDYEKVAIAEYEAILGRVVEPAGFIVHRELDWIGGSPDGLCVPFGGIEVKCPVKLYCNVPDYYIPQMQGLMEVTNRGWWDFAVWTPEEMRVTRVYRSRQYWQELFGLLCEFWTYVEADVEPPVFKRGSKPRISATVRCLSLHPVNEGA